LKPLTSSPISLPDFREVGFDDHHADHLVLERDGPGHQQAVAAEGVPRLPLVQDVRADRGRGGRRPEIPDVLREKGAVEQENARGHDVFIDGHGVEGLAGAARIAEGERCGAVVPDDVRQETGVAAEPLTRARDVVRQDEHAGDDNRRGAGRDTNRGQLPRHREIPKPLFNVGHRVGP
jgi:hypothetical protein